MTKEMLMQKDTKNVLFLWFVWIVNNLVTLNKILICLTQLFKKYDKTPIHSMAYWKDLPYFAKLWNKQLLDKQMLEITVLFCFFYFFFCVSPNVVILIFWLWNIKYNITIQDKQGCIFLHYLSMNDNVNSSVFEVLMTNQLIDKQSLLTKNIVIYCFPCFNLWFL